MMSARKVYSPLSFEEAEKIELTRKHQRISCYSPEELSNYISHNPNEALAMCLKFQDERIRRKLIHQRLNDRTRFAGENGETITWHNIATMLEKLGSPWSRSKTKKTKYSHAPHRGEETSELPYRTADATAYFRMSPAQRLKSAYQQGLFPEGEVYQEDNNLP